MSITFKRRDLKPGEAMRQYDITPSSDLIKVLEHIAALELRKLANTDSNFIMGHAEVLVRLTVDVLDLELDFGKQQETETPVTITKPRKPKRGGRGKR